MKVIAPFLAAACFAASARAAAPYRPAAPVTGVVRIWGNAEMAGIVQRWANEFTRFHPQARLEARMLGSDVAIGALTTGRADIALLGREPAPQEVKGFEWIFRYRPRPVEVMTGSLDEPGCSPAVAVLVHKSNPISRLTFAQLDAVFSPGPHSVRHWGELGLTGAWAGRAIHPYMPGAETGTGTFFRETVLGGARQLGWDRVTEVEDTAGPGAPPHDAGRKLVRLVAADADALAVAPMSAPVPADVKIVALARKEGDEAVLPTRASILARRYPLLRIVRAYVNEAPPKPVDPQVARALDARVAEFLRYVLSAEGQAEVEADGKFLPLAR